MGFHGTYRNSSKINFCVISRRDKPALAFSLRKLIYDYNGACLRVRRSSDNVEQDIYFKDNFLDESQLINFIGSSSGFVVTWYDQCLNINATQANTTLQPRIANAGLIDKVNGKIAIYFDGTKYMSGSSGIFTGSLPRSIITIYKPFNSTGTFSYTVFNQGLNVSNNTWSGIQARTQFVTGDPYYVGYQNDIGNGRTIPNTFEKMASYFYNGITGFLYKNKRQVAFGNITSASIITDPINIGWVGYSLSKEIFYGHIKEIIIYSKNIFAQKELIEQNLMNYYNINDSI